MTAGDSTGLTPVALPIAMGASASLTSCKNVATNPCKLCNPLGACLAFSGVEGCIPLLHGSQGCSTYIRRYLISHFREPVDIASSNFSEETAVFGGGANLKNALDNIIRAYKPGAIGLATTCLSETIGEDIAMIVREWRNERTGRTLPALFHVGTPSYAGTHADGYHAAVAAIVEQLAEGGSREQDLVNIVPGMVSPADLRHLREMVATFGLRPIVLPDYSDRLDGGTWDEYQVVTPGGTTLEDIRRMGRAAATIEFAYGLSERSSAGAVLARRFGVPYLRLGWPTSVSGVDAFVAALEKISGRPTPHRLAAERARLIDSFVDAHKYVFAKKAVVYGEVDLVVAVASLLAEIGISPAICATGEPGKRLRTALDGVLGANSTEGIRVLSDVDFDDIGVHTRVDAPDLIIGNSKGYRLARELNVPLVRVGFPIHDRIGAARVMHVGYAGGQQLFDRIVNALLEHRQDESEVGFSYL